MTFQIICNQFKTCDIFYNLQKYKNQLIFETNKLNSDRLMFKISNPVPSIMITAYIIGCPCVSALRSTKLAGRFRCLIRCRFAARIYWPSRAKHGTKFNRPIAPLNATIYFNRRRSWRFKNLGTSLCFGLNSSICTYNLRLLRFRKSKHLQKYILLE